MESTLFQFVFRYSMHQQLRLLLLTLIAFPFLYLSLELPKTIINEAIGGSDFPHEIPFLEISLTQVEYLFLLSGLFLSLVFVNGGFKYVINVYGGIVGERMLRRLRYQLFERVLRFPLSNFRKVGQGEIVSMVITETDPLGGFMGDAVKLPAFQGGTLFVIVIFMLSRFQFALFHSPLCRQRHGFDSAGVEKKRWLMMRHWVRHASRH